MAVSTDNQYQQLLAMDKQSLIYNTEPNWCQLCDNLTSIGLGVVLVNCLHTFCIGCLKVSLLNATTIRCPFPNGCYECVGSLEHREIEALLSPAECHDFMNRQIAALEKDTESMQKQLDLLKIASDASVVPNPEPVECPICMDTCEAYKGVTLTQCFHCLCCDCLIELIKLAEDVDVKCPIKDSDDKACESVIQHREIKSLLSADEYNRYLERSLKKAELSAENAFHCKTPDCVGWCLIEDNVTLFLCPVCKAQNCVPCGALHAGKTCQDFKHSKEMQTMDKLSHEEVEKMLTDGVAMRCPKCRIALTKIAGCDAIVCSICKTQVCWATKGPRWGPRGPGDTSGGCRCNVNGQRCHPNCQNCH
uniref:Putative sharpin and rbck1 related protein n=1 Tax=Aedes albopictus TaxID=7160 RepID=A0A023EQM3_AEDAL